MTEQTTTDGLFDAVRHNALSLGLFALLTVGLVSLTWLATKDRIVDQVRASEERALHEVLPADRFDNSLLDTSIPLPDTTLLGPVGESARGWVAFHEGDPAAVILPVVAPDGYSGRIQLLVSIDSHGVLTGVRAVSHKETPGLGDGIDTRVSNWILAFTGKSLLNPEGAGWGVKKDGGNFDQFTGATITPRAVVGAIHRSLKYFDANKTTLFTLGSMALTQQIGQSQKQSGGHL
ncbi:electron transport complex subunit RsxG [Sansalvadorimonas verongulae]|uniref:electron transport complex subunit RsxG n=1 Tax=Sansalvadorimonas verongulae TaxID=2172824 RepID=UPI0012BBFF95|nr:electron transport complex subunit RsxG [Sansalvadorimonas verongulae]MTI13836.1 electron transport complex subunit RsxG [Sansalvadorimonas verongulae]